MSDTPIFFEFPQERDMRLAYDTLFELGYRPGVNASEGKSTLHIHVEGQDLASAMQIAQAHAGELIDAPPAAEVSYSEPEAYAAAYDLDTIRIPAHLIQDPEEDAPEGTLAAVHNGDGIGSVPDAYTDAAGAGADGSYEEPQRQFDPSDDDLDRFSAGIHL
ncbi:MULTISPECIES: hypothetical protein [unclassified Paenibacillus]|uniref:hypothetical protein n=1 Tax=unclassified Paenibacillus TaxID=185978 RepID=UPI00020D6C38|nr:MULTISPECIES: hypothetical protein [unclassified Paenibacillus]EGL15288.1 hypothetical protein HMPREF9413_1360 [Paenibacillus sp. HGF7]EPD88829.1 hypothetical protein HMPREF1207_01970 [Paenibacillus sp. HGH0039]